jgi:hypothetical protein
LGPESTLECTYSAVLPDDDFRVNTATVTTSGDVGGDEATADIDFTDVVPTTTGYDEVTVYDDLVDETFGPFSSSTSFQYPYTFDCSEAEYDEGASGAMYTNNEAEIVETGDDDSATVTVYCYQLSVTKDADTSFDREWTWEIEKTGNETSLVLSEGQTAWVNYTVSVTPTPTDDNWAVSGTITIVNPHPTRVAELIDLVDFVGAEEMTVDCAELEVLADDSLVCTYSGTLLDSTGGTNTATATQQTIRLR